MHGPSVVWVWWVMCSLCIVPRLLFGGGPRGSQAPSHWLSRGFTGAFTAQQTSSGFLFLDFPWTFTVTLFSLFVLCTVICIAGDAVWQLRRVQFSYIDEQSLASLKLKMSYSCPDHFSAPPFHGTKTNRCTSPILGIDGCGRLTCDKCIVCLV